MLCDPAVWPRGKAELLEVVEGPMGAQGPGEGKAGEQGARGRAGRGRGSAGPFMADTRYCAFVKTHEVEQYKEGTLV